MPLNLYAAWVGFLFGALTGTLAGLFFHHEDWLDGYNSWPRRLIRLGHISFFGIGFINLAFALTVSALSLVSGVRLASHLFLIGAVTMPLICYLSAWQPPLRKLFFIPVLSLTLGIALFLWRILPS